MKKRESQSEFNNYFQSIQSDYSLEKSEEVIGKVLLALCINHKRMLDLRLNEKKVNLKNMILEVICTKHPEIKVEDFIYVYQQRLKNYKGTKVPILEMKSIMEAEKAKSADSLK